MCLGIPVKIIAKHEHHGIAESNGVTRVIDLRLVEPVNVGDYVILHAGFGIQKIDEHEVAETLALVREMGEL